MVRGRSPWDRRQVFDGIWWPARTGSPWRDIPERYGPWETASRSSAAGRSTALGPG
ncbi:transposase [Streptomyces subrutilus]|uniref:transposase n=1 Tax=Streptomyces subrutilus TaxID=36818 RepID=UPI001AD7F060